jgi:CDP-paratose 2-epimerase
MKILITGGCGFVGSNLALHALQKGHDLHIVDNLYRVGSRSNLDWLQEQGKFVFHNVDTSDSSQIEAVISKFHPDAIFHMAGQVAMTTSIKDPMLDFRTNALVT